MKAISSKWVIIFIVLCYLVFLSLYISNFNNGLSADDAKLGSFGAFMSGALSPVIGIITILLTYNIIKGQEIQNRQNEFKYMFELLFGSMEKNRNSIKIERFDKEEIGREAIIRMNQNIENLYKSLNLEENSDKEQNFRKAFWSIHVDTNGSSDTYMKSIHNLLKIIDRDCISDRKSSYAALFRAQLNKNELKFIFYNGLASDDFQDFKKRLEKFYLLKDLVDNKEIEVSLRSRYKWPKK